MSRPLRFSANLNWLYTEQLIEIRPSAAAAPQFRAIEHPSAVPFARKPAGRLLRDAGVQQVLVNTPTGPCGGDTEFSVACIPAASEEFRAGFARALQYTVAIACPTINVMAGVQPPALSRRRATDTYLENLAWASSECGGPTSASWSKRSTPAIGPAHSSSAKGRPPS